MRPQQREDKFKGVGTRKERISLLEILRLSIFVKPKLPKKGKKKNRNNFP